MKVQMRSRSAAFLHIQDSPLKCFFLTTFGHLRLSQTFYFLFPTNNFSLEVFGTFLIVRDTLVLRFTVSPTREPEEVRFRTFSSTQSSVDSSMPCKKLWYSSSFKMSKLLGR